MGNKSLTIIAAIAIVGLLFLIYLAATYESPGGSTTVEMEQPVAREPEPGEVTPEPDPPQPTDAVLVPEPEPAAEVAEAEPEPEEEPEVVELPALNVSDDFVLEQIGSLDAGTNLLRVVASDEVIRKFVVFVENVSRGTLPQLEFPVRRIEEEMPVRTVDQNLFVMEESSYDRFDFMVDTFISVDADQAMAIYETVEPLLQEAYAEIGYASQDFNEVMIEAIDNVLSASSAEGPFQLVKPSVMYQYADAEIEEMNEVEKQLIRLGPENREKLQQKLREFRAALEARE